jgi:predicted fused transcriptional regulator/phosphomethylpyrimidine kinase
MDADVAVQEEEEGRTMVVGVRANAESRALVTGVLVNVATTLPRPCRRRPRHVVAHRGRLRRHARRLRGLLQPRVGRCSLLRASLSLGSLPFHFVL